MAAEFDDLIIKRTFNCPKRTLFDAWSQPAVMAKWLFARREDFCESTVTNSFTVGGAYSITMHMPSSDVKLFGEYTAITRYALISFTWSSPVISNSRIALTFKELSANRTEFTLTHALFPSEDVRAQHGAGWEACLDNLESRVLSAGAAKHNQT